MFFMNHTINNERAPIGFFSASIDADGIIVSSMWDFSDGSNTTGTNVSHTYPHYVWDGADYVPYTVELTVTDNDNNTDNTTLEVNVFMQGDVNGDGVVNIEDVVPIGKAWRASVPSITYNDGADLNNDNTVNIMDVAYVGLNWRNHAVQIV